MNVGNLSVSSLTLSPSPANCLQVYDRDVDGWVTRDDFFHFFTASMLVTVDANIEEIATNFIDQLFIVLDPEGVGKFTLPHVWEYLQAHPDSSVYSLFGRAVVGGV